MYISAYLHFTPAVFLQRVQLSGVTINIERLGILPSGLKITSLRCLKIIDLHRYIDLSNTCREPSCTICKTSEEKEDEEHTNEQVHTCSGEDNKWVPCMRLGMLVNAHYSNTWSRVFDLQMQTCDETCFNV